MKAAQSVFSAGDKNRNGLLDVSEFGAVLRRYGLNPSNREISDAIRGFLLSLHSTWVTCLVLDVDQSGFLSFDEFLGFIVIQESQNGMPLKKHTFNG